MGYGRFAAMTGTSTVVIFGLMYPNTYALDHIFFSQTRMWMALYMGAAMAVIMLAFMFGLYSNRTLNIAIFVGAIEECRPTSEFNRYSKSWRISRPYRQRSRQENPYWALILVESTK